MSATSPVFRTTTYRVAAGDFSGTSTKIHLRYTLSANYFAMVQWGHADTGAVAHEEVMAAVTADPFGTGDLAQAGGNWLTLTRNDSSEGDWLGSIVVVECLRDSSGSGFELVHVQSTNLPDFAATGTQAVSEASGVAWGEGLDSIMLLSGWRGGGAVGLGATGTDDIPSAGIRAYPSSTGTLNFERRAVLTTTVEDTDVYTYVVRWGNEWTVQRVNVTGSSGGVPADNVAHYDSTAISDATRANTWVWACGWVDDDGSGDSYMGALATLGDGVSQLGTEAEVSVGLMFAKLKSYEVYALTHSGLACEYSFKPNGDGGVLFWDYAVSAPVATETYYSSDTLRVQHTVGTRYADQWTGLNGTSAALTTEILWHTIPTASTTITAYRGDSPSAWASWLTVADFGGITVPSGEESVFRVTTYRVGSGDFTGTVLDLALLQDLVANYFVMVQGSDANLAQSDPNNGAAAITQDPFSTGTLGMSSGANILRVERFASINEWTGTVTVVECLRDFESHGFQLVTAEIIPLPDYPDPETQHTVFTASAAWSDVGQVVVFGGPRGGGIRGTGALQTSDSNSLYAAFAVAYDDQIRVMRSTNSVGTVELVECTAHVVQWGSAWTVQSVLFAARGGGAGMDAIGEYRQVPVAPFLPAETLIWMGCTTFDNETYRSPLSLVCVPGDGVTVPTTATSVAVSIPTEESWLVSLALVSHPSITVDWRFMALTAATSTDLSTGIPVRGEQYGTTVQGLPYTTGKRFAQAYTGDDNTTGTAYSSATALPRHTTPKTLNVLRDRSDGNMAGWAQSIDLGAVFALTASTIDPDRTPGPVQYLVLQDANWAGSQNVLSATSEGGRYTGPAVPANGNVGSLVAFQDGDAQSDVEYDYLITTGGGLATSAGFAWKETTQPDTDWKSLNGEVTFMHSYAANTNFEFSSASTTFSDAFQRLLLFVASGSATITVYYRAVDANPSAPWATTSFTTVFGAVDEGISEWRDSSPSRSGMECEELPDGTLLLAVTMANTLTGFLNINLYQSQDGGLTWALHTHRVLNQIPALTSQPDGVALHRMAIAGDWIRLCFLDQDESANSPGNFETIVSSNRGQSWSRLTPVQLYSWDGFAANPRGKWPYAIGSIGDVSGTMLVVYLGASSGSTLWTSIADRDNDWSRQISMDLDHSSYATGAEVKAVAFGLGYDRLWLYVWVEGSDNSQIVAHYTSLDNPKGDGWTTLGIVTAFDALQLGIYQPKAVWCGNHMVISGGVLDWDDVSTPVELGHSMLVAQGWDSQALALDKQDNQDIQALLPSGGWTVEWHVALGIPDVDPLSNWTRATSSGTISRNARRLLVSTGSSTGFAYFELDQGGAPTYSWGGTGRTGSVFHWIVGVLSTRITPTAGEDYGVRIKALGGGGDKPDFSIRMGTTQFVVYDNVAGGIVHTESTTDLAGSEAMVEMRVALKADGIAVRLVVMWRLLSDERTVQWNRTASIFLDESGAHATQQIRWGVLASTGVAGTSTGYWRDVCIAGDSSLGQFVTDNSQIVQGALTSTYSILIQDGVRARFGGSGAAKNDAFQGLIDHSRGTTNLGLDSPRYLWESADLTEQALVFEATRDLGTATRWVMNALLLIGTIDRTAVLEFNNTDNWTTPAASFQLDSDLYTDLTITDMDGASIKVSSASGVLPSPGELLGKTGKTRAFLRIVNGPNNLMTFGIVDDKRIGEGWLQLDGSLDLQASGVVVGEAAVIFGDRMVWRGDAFRQYHYFRVVFPDVTGATLEKGTAYGVHRLGSLVPGFWRSFEVPLDWTWRDNEQPNVTEQRSRGAVTWNFEEGPAQRIMEGKMVGDYTQQLREQLRGLIRELHGYNVKPMGLIVNSKSLSRETVVFGRWQSGSQKDEAGWFPDTAKAWNTAGDLDLVFVEEV